MTAAKPHLDHSPDRPSAETRRTGAARSLRSTVLAYHELSTDPTPYTYTLAARQFEDHLQLAASLKRESVLADDRLIISFDDGHISNYTSALPLLEKHSCKAIFFVIAGRIGERHDFMTWDHLRELISLGHRVEAHGWSHTFLTSCSDPELQTEVKRAKETIEDRLGSSVSALSAPHGRWDDRVLRACQLAGYMQLYTSNPWNSRRNSGSIEVIGRQIVVQSMNVEQLRRWLTMGSAEAALRRAKQNLKDSARYILGDRLYYRMWSRFSGFTGPDDYASESKPAI